MPLFLAKILNNRILASIAIGTFITFIISAAFLFGFFRMTNLKLTDSQYTLNDPSQDIVIIAIDEKSTQPQPQGLGRYSQWSRENHIKLLSVLQKEQAKAITFDILFNKPTETIPLETISVFKNGLSANLSQEDKLKAYDDFLNSNSSSLRNPVDQAFADKLNEFKNIVLIFLANPDDAANSILPLKKFSKNAALGNYFAKLDEDGILRKVQPIFKDGTTDFAVQSAMKYLGVTDVEKLNLPTEDSQMNVNFFAPPFGYKMISFVDVLNGKFAQDAFKNKIVLIGVTSFKENEDRVLTPRDNATPMPGIEFRANEIQTIIEGKFLTNQSTGATIFTIAIISIGLAIALNYLGILLSILVTFASILLYIFTSHVFYKNGLLVNMLYPFVAIIFTYLTSWIYKYFIADRKKRELKSAFGHYVNEELVDQISKNPDMVKLGGEKKIVTVFFSDIKDSTAHSEKTPIELWISQVNEYFTVMGNVLKKSGGTLDKYEGDAIMGFWNAPISQQDHILRAYACAIGMRKALVNLHAKWAQEGKALIEFRIGINTGEALVGNFGSADQFNFTVMGDTVNTASRLESAANKAYGTKMIVAGFENANVNFTIRELDTVYLPGKKEPVKLFELICLASEATPEIQNLVKTYNQGLAAYRCKDFATAITSFTAIQTTLPSFKTDNPTQILLSRCQKLQAGEKIAELDEQMIFRIQNK